MTVQGSDTCVDKVLYDRIAQESLGKLCLYRNGMPSKTRKFIVLNGFGPSHNLGVFNNNVDTVARALVERYFLCKQGDTFRPALRVHPRAYNTPTLINFRELVMSHMPRLPKLSRQQVVDRYSGAKKRVYERALLSLQLKPICKDDARLDMFSKFEKQDLGKASRGINPRSSRYNLKLGQYLKIAEKKFFRAINKVYGNHTKHTVIKGINADEAADVLLSKWNRFSDPVAVGLDATKFDMHVSETALRYEHSFYTSLFPGCKELVELLKWQLNNTGRSYLPDGTVKFSINGTRASGDLNTSLGNCIIMCSLIYSYTQNIGIPVELANNGDDCVVFMERSELAKFSTGVDKFFTRHGFAMAVEQPVYEFEQLEFCQTHPVHLSHGWRMVRNHSAVLTKDPICLTPIPNQRIYRNWLHAVGAGGTHLASGCPVQQSFYTAFLRNGVKGSDTLMQQIHKNDSYFSKVQGLHKCTEISSQSRVSYYYAFGVTPDQQIELERFYDSAVIADVDTQSIPREHLAMQSGLSLIDHA